MILAALADLAAALADAGDWAPPARPAPPAASAPVEPVRPMTPRPKAPVPPPPPPASVYPGRILQAPPPPPVYQLRGGSGTTWTHPDPHWLAAWVRQSDPPRPVQLVPRYTYTHGTVSCVGGVCRVRGR
jgi:hypothetical protein